MRNAIFSLFLAISIVGTATYAVTFDEALIAAGEDNVDIIAAMGRQAIIPNLSSPWTLLHEAANNGSFKVAAYLIKLGANVNAQDGSKYTPLHIAVLKRNDSIVGLLMDHNADYNMVDASGESPFALALRLKYYCVATLAILRLPMM